MNYPISEEDVKKELSEAVSCHIKMLRDIHFIEPDSMDAFTFTIRSFGFILERIPNLLIREDIEESYFAIFQYYNLLAELKRNLLMSYPHAKIHDVPFSEILKPFPTRYQKEINQWWEAKTGLQVDSTKQTINL